MAMKKISFNPIVPAIISIVVIALCPHAAVAQAPPVFEQEPARISCNAAYSAPCARQNSRFLATSMTTNYVPSTQLFNEINNGDLNMDIGFYPFVFDRTTKQCVAHGADRTLVGLTLEEIFVKSGIGYADAKALYTRFEQAGGSGGGWTQYLWNDGGSTNSKLAYVVNFTSSYLVGVGYEETQLPPDLPCSDKFDSFCSMTNVRSLVGKAQFRLYEAAQSLENFESAVFDISFNDDFKIEGGFYAFMYNYDGRLKAHGVLRDSFVSTLPDIFVDKRIGTRQQGSDLHQDFIDAAEGNGWVNYEWSDGGTPYQKIAFVVKVEFGSDQYYLGVGFNYAKAEIRNGPLGEPCSPKSNLPCAFSTALQLSSHALAWTISSPDSLQSIFNGIAQNPTFKSNDFYVFVYEFDGECVAHGSNPEYAGMTLTEVFREVNIDVDGDVLHEKFKEAAIKGGGFVLYDWLDPNVPDSDFQKISYIFRMNLQGKDYYGGVGFNHQRAPTQELADSGRDIGGERIPCSSLFGLTCSEVNSRAILGQALAELVLSSNDARVTTQDSARSTVEDMLDLITSRSDEELSINDFYVSVFAFGSDLCEPDSRSGCCVAHGQDPDFVHQTWDQILDSELITSIEGSDLHTRLSTKARAGGGWIEYPWSKATGIAQTKRSWTVRFRNGDAEYYVVAEYLKSPQPPTCDSCPDDMECTKAGQKFCTEKPPQSLIETPLVKALIILFAVGTVVILLLCWCQKRRAKAKIQAMQAQVDEMATQMQGMMEVVADMPHLSPEQYSEQIKTQSNKSQTPIWYWEEDSSHLQSHSSNNVLRGSRYVRYAPDVCDQLDQAYNLYLEGKGFKILHLNLSTSLGGVKAHNAKTGLEYDIDFEHFKQKNSKSNHERHIQRGDKSDKSPTDQSHTTNIEFPPLPEDVDFGKDGEDLLCARKGQIIQVSKIHSNDLWLYGNVLYDPLLHAAQDKNQLDRQSSGLNDVLAQALHDRPTSGWFPRCVVVPADVKVMSKLFDAFDSDGLDLLTPPDRWEKKDAYYRDGRLQVDKKSEEYSDVAYFFQTALYSQQSNISVTNIERIQNLPLWQSYAVNKQSMITRDRNDPSSLINNLTGCTELKWLFHGTHADVVRKIERQGFNRAFAGRSNAVRYGKGVYFARDASYSSHKTYSVPNKSGVQQMFLCRVAVGDWCKGTEGQLTPDPKPNNRFDLFDSTVDNVSSPSIFVVYTDAQAYPEYLVSFKHN